MQNSILHATTKFSLYNLMAIDTLKEMDEKSVREYILEKTPKLLNGKSAILHIIEGIEKEETVFTFERGNKQMIEDFLRNIDKNLEKNFPLEIKKVSEKNIPNQEDAYLNTHGK